MRRGLISLWSGLSPWIRIGVVGAFLLAAGVMLLFGYFWIYGWTIGGVLLLFAFPSKAEQRGYHDF
jgi:hypothetical protein